VTAAVSVIRPAQSRYEGALIAAAILAVIAVLLAYVQRYGSEREPEPLLEWQVSAFATLTGADQAIYNSLYTVQDEIPYMYDDINMFNGPGDKFRWPNLDESFAGRISTISRTICCRRFMRTRAGSRPGDCAGRCTSRWPRAKCRARQCISAPMANCRARALFCS